MISPSVFQDKQLMYVARYKRFHHYACGRAVIDVYHDLLDGAEIRCNDPLGILQSDDQDHAWHGQKNGEQGYPKPIMIHYSSQVS
jgi:hypothetical protein